MSRQIDASNCGTQCYFVTTILLVLVAALICIPGLPAMGLIQGKIEVQGNLGTLSAMFLSSIH